MPLEGCRWRTDCPGKFPFLNGNPSARTHSCTNPGRSAAKHFRFPFRLASFRPVRCGAYLSEFAAVALPALASSPYCPCNVFRVARSYFHTYGVRGVVWAHLRRRRDGSSRLPVPVGLEGAAKRYDGLVDACIKRKHVAFCYVLAEIVLRRCSRTVHVAARRGAFGRWLKIFPTAAAKL